MPRTQRWPLIALPLVSLVGCGSLTTASGSPAMIPDADVRALFVGNSLTYTNDLPARVAALAEAAGLSFAYVTQAMPGWSLEEHWAAGIRNLIAGARADVVVLQQGPSSLPESQEHLAFWTAQMAPAIRGAGGEPALLMVWPGLG